jgi:aspartate kinase
VSSPDRFQRIAEQIAERYRAGDQLVVVVSAMRNMTDRLHQLARQVHPNPPAREQDMLVSAGERISIALLAMALQRLECRAISFTGSQSGILTSTDHTDARITDVRPGRILEALERGEVAIVAGYQGVSSEREITTLGRGGSDLSAVALAVAIGAEQVEFYKDVAGIYSGDPYLEPDAELQDVLSYDQALELVRGHPRPVLHPRAIALAKANGMPLRVRSFEGGEGESRIVGTPSAKKVFETACH